RTYWLHHGRLLQSRRDLGEADAMRGELDWVERDVDLVGRRACDHQRGDAREALQLRQGLGAELAREVTERLVGRHRVREDRDAVGGKRLHSRGGRLRWEERLRTRHRGIDVLLSGFDVRPVLEE